MRQNCKASIIIPSYNSIRTIPFTIENILEQDNFCCIEEIIVVDSSDDNLTKDFLYSIKHEKVRIIDSGIRVMPSIQRNMGANEAKGDVLVFIDSDAYPAKNWLTKIMSAYNEGWIAGGGAYLIPEFQKDNKVALAQYYFEFGGFLPVGKTRILNIMPACNLFCDRIFFLSMSGFPNIRAADDSLFCLAVSKHIKMIFMPDACVYHIFRENTQDFLDNQFLIGKFNFIFHINYYNRLCLRPPIFTIAQHFLLTYKFFLKLSLFFKVGQSHWLPFLKALKYFYMANRAWFNGFKEGEKSPVNEIVANMRQVNKSLLINEFSGI
jgi:glycosyltransferase involved in cell wall biosynthesis